jgi:hypothetical protein
LLPRGRRRGAAQAAAQGAALCLPVAETGFDPAKISDLYSRTVTPHIFEALYIYDHLARPAKIKPLTADGMPESADFRTWTVKVRPASTLPTTRPSRARSASWWPPTTSTPQALCRPGQQEPGLGLAWRTGRSRPGGAARRRWPSKKPFDYDAPIEGLKVLDRYTLQFTLEEPRPRFIETMAVSDLFGAVAREVVEAYGDKIGAHPVGTGPFRLAQWRRVAHRAGAQPRLPRTLLRRHSPRRRRRRPGHRRALKGRRCRWSTAWRSSVIENQPRWLSFLNGRAGLLERVPAEFITHVAMPGGRLAPNLAKQGIQRLAHAAVRHVA